MLRGVFQTGLLKKSRRRLLPSSWNAQIDCGPVPHRTVRYVSLVMVISAGTTTGCAYSSKRPFPTDIQTIHVDTFQSKEFRRELEFRLTESLVKRIEMDTPYRVGPRKTADALLSGEILQVRNRVFGDDFKLDQPREIGSTLVVRYRLEDMRTGKILVERPRFVYQTSYIPPVGETFSDAMTRAMDGLAEQIVESMESTW